MEFKLNLDPHNQHAAVYTDAAAYDRAVSLARAGGARARGGLARVSATAGARARAAGSAALSRARDVGRNRYADVKAFKDKWHRWLYNEPGKTNFWLLISNVLYIAVSLTVLVLTFIVMHEHVDDFKRNEFTEHYVKDADNNPTSVLKQYPPCGMPTPDSMYLLQAINALPAAGWDGASLEPNYKSWMQKVDRALCARIVPGKQIPAYDDDITVCEGNGYIDYGTDFAEELLALGYLMDDDTITPTLEDVDVAQDLIDKNAAFERRACLVKKADPDHPTEEPYYTEQQRKAYGDLKTRVARAYIAAMPAFSRYQKERSTCAEGVDQKDPFDVMCKHSCHVRKELKAAAAQQELLYTTAQIPAGTTLIKQLYRLLALSLAGYYDRYHNNGVCFRNDEVYAAGDTIPSGFSEGDHLSAYTFCENSMNPTTPGNDMSFTNDGAVTEFTKQNQNVELNEQCGLTAYPPPPPAPPIYRIEPTKGLDKKLSAQVCAATLQYGLFEQGRLFGIPDVIAPFVVDNRVDRGLHFIGELIYDAMYVKPRKKAADILADPKSKLELYIAYRLSSTSIWAILVANVAGFMLVRAAAPMGVYILKFLGVTSNVKQKLAGRTGEFEPIKLVRPQIGWPIYLAQGVNLLVIYWIFFIDPATQSHYYITPTCEDWQGLGVHVPSGAFGTTWGKRRYGRFGEHLIGLLLVFTLLFVVFQQAIGRAMVSPELVKDAKRVKLGATARLDKIALIMIGFALSIQILFISQSIVSGDDWFQAIKASDNDHAVLVTFSKDVLMSVWAAFWTSASISWYRQKWAIDSLKAPFQYGWMAGSLVLLWMPVFQSAALLSDEIDVAFSDGKGTSDTPRLIICIFIYAFSAIWTVVLLVRLKAVYNAIPDKSTNSTKFRSAENVASQKNEIKRAIANAEASKAEEERLALYDFISSAPASRPMFNLSGMTVPAATVPVKPQRKAEAVYMPLLPSQ